jgi:hypothetical protein
MNFERSPFLAPWATKKLRRVRSVSFETPDAPTDGFFLHNGAYILKLINTYNLTMGVDVILF